MNYIQLRLRAHNAQNRTLVEGWLTANTAINGWEETEDGALVAYISEADFTDEMKADLQQKQQECGFDCTTELFPDQNWNALWEQSYQPVEVEGFCRVRASFHAPDSRFKHDLHINPQMSFGTGHHSTTYMMLANMENEDWRGKTVLDYGCGTAVLAILAAKLGAQNIDAIDIDEWAYRNALENVLLNATPNVAVYQGDLSALPNPAQQYDYILANINRNVLLMAMPTLAKMLKKGGQLWLSGFLVAESPLLLEAAQTQGLSVIKQQQREQWGWLQLFND